MENDLEEEQKQILKETMAEFNIEEFDDNPYIEFWNSHKRPGKLKIQIDGELYSDEIKILAVAMERMEKVKI